ncbi:MAG TPA: chemotaxis-specific protein-glutamate methyltransferase CheB [Steroidobacteraceae bacterium]|nr:chemotaxis-specific protein-glutamate methyltransferase CheB [Steroidobacteraceae bacterium]
MIKVLVVDDSALVRKLFGRVLSEDTGFEVALARNGLEALALLEQFKPDVVTLDVQMPQMNGLECLDRIMVQRPCPVVMVASTTAEGAEATLSALKLGAVDFVPKPTGAVSLSIDEFAPTFLEKIRAAASAKLPASRRLRERVQFRAGGAASSVRLQKAGPEPAESAVDDALEVAQGEGLVLVGTSTGGPPALEALLLPLPASFPWPILVAQHMPASFTGSLAKRLDGICSINVIEVRQPTLLQVGCAYIGRGDADIVVSKRASSLVAMTVPINPSYPWHPSTDRLVRSAMEHLPPAQLIGILMTGMGDDGAKAMTELRLKGGRTIAEAEETAVIWGMPGELVRAAGATWTLPLPRIAQKLKRLMPDHAAHPQTDRSPRA